MAKVRKHWWIAFDKKRGFCVTHVCDSREEARRIARRWDEDYGKEFYVIGKVVLG